ncbi:MFS transporter [Tsukamurella pulmonis]|uniref:MFS transporter n=1 Tax=Tsukamurella pulmonis TaxID=47312 RepID=UPI001EE0519A|nr:MFS transporter [Tsukamurella pulmonis]BDD84773.1 MFS transporter [Tsukamurella pulmonis]
MSQSHPLTVPADEALLARLDGVEPGKPHRRLMVMGGLGYTFDSFDGALMGYALSALIVIWHIPKGTAGWLLSSIFFGYLVGALLAGVLADRFGRRRLMLTSLLIFCTCSLLMGTSGSVTELFVWRVLAGLGIGAETALIAPYIAEFLPARVRGKFVARTVGFLSFGYILAGVVAPLVISPNPETGWRIAAVICALPVLLLLWWRRSMPESPRYLLAQGRTQDAAAVVERFERECGVEPAATTLDAAAAASAAASSGPVAQPSALDRLAGLWSGPVARTTLVIWTLWFVLTGVNYGFTSWLPTLLVTEKGFTITKSFLFALVTAIAQVPGYYLATRLIDKMERKWLIAVYAAGATVSALIIALSSSETMLLVGASLLAAFVNGAAAVYYTYTAELYPTAIRATGMGAASAVGRMGAIIAPITIGYLSAAGLSFSTIFLFLVGLLAVGIMVVVAFGPKTSGRTLEVASHA